MKKNKASLERERQEHWLNLGIHDEKNLKEHIKAIFERHTHQADILIDIYKLLFPCWEQVEQIESHPKPVWNCRNLFFGALWSLIAIITLTAWPEDCG